MAVSRNTGHRPRGTFWKQIFGQLTRYDLVLTAIPLVFVLALVVHTLLAISLHAALAVGAVLSIGAVMDALFVHPPVESESASR